MPEDRRLAAIMFTDIVGYTKLMGEDEDKAFKVLRKNREIQRPIIKKYRGEWLKEMGDGILASFTTASDAVRCAGEIQQAAKKEGIALRIGIHSGEVVFEGHDVLGDGVNVASRLEELAEEGCINISGTIYKDIKNKAGIVAEFVEEKELKNVDEPVKVYTVTCEESSPDTSSRETTESNVPDKKSIIVLPFDNMSPDPDQEFFSDGLTEEIITDLSHIHDLLVISRSSAMTFKGTKKKIKEIASEVNVRYVLEGSVRKAGNNLRIVAQLIDAISDTHIWAEKYNGTLDDVFEIQEKVSRSITDALKIKLSSNELSIIEKKKIDDAIAYEQYLLARKEIWTCTKESLSHAIQLLNNSLDKIGRNEYLLVALGLAYFQYVNTGIDPKPEHLNNAANYIDEALILNPSFAKAYYLKSAIHETRGELMESFKSIKRSLFIDPNDSEALLMIACMYAFVGKPEKGISYAKHTIESDPLNPIGYFGEWWIHLSLGNLEQALKTAKIQYELTTGNLLSIWWYAQTLAINGKVKKATELYDSLYKQFPDQFLAKAGKAFRHAINNERQKALQSIGTEFTNAADMDHLWAWHLTEVYSLIGEKEKAIDYLERATRDVFINYPFISQHDPLLENIRGEKRFNKLMEDVKYRWENFED